MFEDSEWRDILSTLLNLTNTESITWREFQLKESSTRKSPVFYVQAGATRYVLQSVDDDGRYPYRLSALRKPEPSADKFVRVADFVGVGFIEGDDSPSQLLDELYPIVKRLVTGAPQLAKSLLDELRSIPPF